MQVIDIVELTDPEKYRPKMSGYSSFKNFEIQEIVKQTNKALRSKDTQSQSTNAYKGVSGGISTPGSPPRGFSDPTAVYVPKRNLSKVKVTKPRGVSSNIPRMSPSSSLSSKVPASLANENAYSDLETDKRAPIKQVDQRAERQKLQEKYANLRKQRQE